MNNSSNSSSVVSLYGIELGPIVVEAEDSTDTTSDVEIADAESEAAACVPFPDASSDGALGYIDELPGAKEDEHTFSLSLSEDGSIVAVGIDSFDGEDRGLVRTFKWSCQEGKYDRLGHVRFSAVFYHRTCHFPLAVIRLLINFILPTFV